MLTHARNFRFLKFTKNIAAPIKADTSIIQEYTIVTARLSRYSAGTNRYNNETADMLKNAQSKKSGEEIRSTILFMTRV